MTNVQVTKSIKVPAKDAWSKLAAFGGIEEFSPIERSVLEGEGEGAKRTCYLPDGAAINEILSKLDHENMHLEYKILSGPFPITDYTSDIRIQSTMDGNCEINWSCNFNTDPAKEPDMKNLFTGFYNTIIDSLEAIINKN